jgi:hypothetical protein
MGWGRTLRASEREGQHILPDSDAGPALVYSEPTSVATTESQLSAGVDLGE